jgi:hypothetical protein
MTEYTLEASVKLGMIEYALVASVDPYGSLLAEGIAECHYTGPQPVTTYGSFLRGKRWCRKLRLKVALVVLRRMVIRLAIILLGTGLIFGLLLGVLRL